MNDAGPRGFAHLALALLAFPQLGPFAPDTVEPEDLARAVVHLERAAGTLSFAENVRVLYTFTGAPALFVEAPARSLEALARDPRVAWIEREEPITFDLDTATLATRARDVFDAAYDPATPPVVDAVGHGVDGTGIGIAIVDTGLDATHPDFAAPGKVALNAIVTPEGLVEAPYTHAGDGHGTHVAGIAAGTGASSSGAYSGVAPGATIYAFDAAVGGSQVYPAIAFDWILQHGPQQDPPIRVVTNSWGCRSVACRAANEDPIHVALADRLAREGYVVVFSAGNAGGDTIASTLNEEATIPTPGVIGVASYDDEDRARRTGCVSASSSRGAVSDPATWPDVAAPGERIRSTWAIGPSPQTRTPATNLYREASGTSMAAPHVAGVAALILQAKPSLSPGDVEYLLKSSAVKPECGPGYARADPAHPYDGANAHIGHGLVDAYAATTKALAFAGRPEPPAPEAVPLAFHSSRAAVRVDETLWFTADNMLSAQPPTATAPRARVLVSGESTAYESAPLAAAREVGGFEVGAWIGTTAECLCAHVNGIEMVARVERVDAAGTASLLATDHLRARFVPALGPTYREWSLPLSGAVELPAGERLRVTLSLTSSLTRGAPIVWTLYDASHATPSRLGLGSRVHPILPDTDEHCQVREDCARIGGEREAAPFYCGSSEYRLVWEGPPGSSAVLDCSGAAAACAIPLDAPGPGRCEARTGGPPLASNHGGLCAYRTVDGARGGLGRCVALTPVKD